MISKNWKQVVLGCLCGFLTPAFTCRGGETDIHKAPLYWSVYEYAREMEAAGIPYGEMDITSAQWNAVIDMMATKFKSHGYDMICTDGFLPQTARDGSVYMTHYGSISLYDLVNRARAKGIKVGVYDNPLWIKGNLDSYVPGTSYTLRSLTRNASDKVLYPEVTDRAEFTWLVTDHPGAREYIDGWFRHYHDMGVDFVRMDFMCWYEDGDPGRAEPVTCGYGRARYELGLKYIREAAEKYGIFTSIVMPELYNDAELESKYCDMMRIVGDTDTGGWDHFSTRNRGKIYNRWPYADNQFDGFTHWAHKGGRGKIILDGDFLRLNKCSTDDERRSQISLQLIAGGPVAIADTPGTIGSLDSFYTNDEMLALNADGFVGKPLSDAVNSDGSCVWYGSMSDGDIVLAMFNREGYSRNMSVDLQSLGISTSCAVRDLWSHADEPSVSVNYTVSVPAHGCKVVRLQPQAVSVPEKLYVIGDACPAGFEISNAREMTKETLADGRVVFGYRGVLYNGNLRFIDGKEWETNTEYGPLWGDGTHLMTPDVPVMIAGDLTHNNFYVHPDNDESGTEHHGNGRGTWTVKVYFGKTVTVEAVRDETRIPERLYLVGDAAPCLWNVGGATAMPRESDGVFTYRGNLYVGRVRFIDARSWEGTAYIPKTYDYALPAIMDYGVGAERLDFRIAQDGTYEITVRFSDGGDTATVEKIERVGDMAPQAIALGHASGSWDSRWPNPDAYLQPKDGAENVFVWEGTLTPSFDKENEIRKHFKFITYPKDWNNGCVYYVPVETDFNGNVRTVKTGDRLGVLRTSHPDVRIDTFWGFAAEDCTPDKVYRVTLNLNDMTVEFADARGMSTVVSSVDMQLGLTARFVGGNLVIEGAASSIAVYNAEGRLVAFSGEGSLTVAGLPSGVYVVKTAEKSVKVMK